MCRNNPHWGLGRLGFKVSTSNPITHTPALARYSLNEWSARRRSCYLQNTQWTQEMNIRTLSGIRSRDPSNRVAVYLRKRRHGRRFQHTYTYCGEKYIDSKYRIGGRLHLKCDGTRWRTGGEVKGKLANGVGSQYPSHYLGSWCIQHYYRWCSHLGCQ